MHFGRSVQVGFFHNHLCNSFNIYFPKITEFKTFQFFIKNFSFPGATSETLLQKFNSVHKNNLFYETPQKREAAFIVLHYAGKVKYQVNEMREKNLDLMRQDIVSVLKNSSMAFVRELVGADPVAVFRWAIVRALFRSYFALRAAGRKHRQNRSDKNKVTSSSYQNRYILM